MSERRPYEGWIIDEMAVALSQHCAGWADAQDLQRDAKQALSEAALQGFALAMGLVGMAEAIRQNAPRLVEREYGTYDTTRYTCFCPGCGSYMKNLRAGVDEGTDNEWCGACRY